MLSSLINPMFIYIFAFLIFLNVFQLTKCFRCQSSILNRGLFYKTPLMCKKKLTKDIKCRTFLEQTITFTDQSYFDISGRIKWWPGAYCQRRGECCYVLQTFYQGTAAVKMWFWRISRMLYGQQVSCFLLWR